MEINTAVRYVDVEPNDAIFFPVKNGHIISEAGFRMRNMSKCRMIFQVYANDVSTCQCRGIMEPNASLSVILTFDIPYDPANPAFQNHLVVVKVRPAERGEDGTGKLFDQTDKVQSQITKIVALRSVFQQDEQTAQSDLLARLHMMEEHVAKLEKEIENMKNK